MMGTELPTIRVWRRQDWWSQCLDPRSAPRTGAAAYGVFGQELKSSNFLQSGWQRMAPADLGRAVIYLRRSRDAATERPVNTVGGELTMRLPDDRAASADIHRDGRRLVASLTTIPSRVHLLPLSVESLWTQRRRPDKLQINIPAYCRRESAPYPDETSLRRLLPYPDSWLVIRTGVADEGPITKLLPTLEDERDSSTVILLVDDDTVYGPDLIRLMLEHRTEHPTHKATGFSGRLAVAVVKRFTPTVTLRFCSNTTTDTGVTFLENFSGGFFERDCFPQQVEQIRAQLSSLPPGCFYTDDIVIGALLARANIERTVVSTGGVRQWVHDNQAPNALRADGNIEWRNVSNYRQLVALGFFPQLAVPWPHNVPVACRRWLARAAAWYRRGYQSRENSL